MARKLIHARIIHGQADLGSLADPLAAVAREELTAEVWRTHQQQVERFWGELKVKVMERVSRELAGMGWERLRVYQDGMPAGGETARRIVEELAEKGSLNYQLIKDLLARGARLEQTEQPDLLKQEYRMIRRIVTASQPAERERARQDYSRASEALLAQRDRFIARRVAATLQEGEVGLLLIGALHRVENHLPKDIAIIPVA